jgi:hypothetical protein
MSTTPGGLIMTKHMGKHSKDYILPHHGHERGVRRQDTEELSEKVRWHISGGCSVEIEHGGPLATMKIQGKFT